jgi:hypothetical protein
MHASRGLNDKEIEAFCSDVKNYDATFRKAFPGRRLLPKHHILVKEAPIFLGKYRSLGMFSEQNVEVIHPEFTILGQRFRNLGEGTAAVRAMLNAFHTRRITGATAPPPTRRKCPKCKKEIRQLADDRCQCSHEDPSN